MGKPVAEARIGVLAQLIRGELHKEGGFYCLEAADAGDIQASLYHLFQAGEPNIRLSWGKKKIGQIWIDTAHLDQILEITPHEVRVQPGLPWSVLQDELQKLDRGILVPDPKNIVALKVVLASGEETWIRPLEPAELEARGHGTSFEAQAYQNLIGDLRMGEKFTLAEELNLQSRLSLLPLFLDAEVHLGIPTEIVLATQEVQPESHLQKTVGELVEMAAAPQEHLRGILKKAQGAFDPYNFFNSAT